MNDKQLIMLAYAVVGIIFGVLATVVLPASYATIGIALVFITATLASTRI
jgi:hypothetical protein